MALAASPRTTGRAGGLGGDAGAHAGTGIPTDDLFRIETAALRVRAAASAADHAAILALRAQAFRGAAAAPEEDGFDPLCRHVLVEERGSGRVLAAFRLLHLASAREIATSYAAQFYDLGRLTGYPGGMAEIGRFCLAETCRDPDVPRLAWAALTRFVDAHDLRLLFGCASFPGTDPAPHAAGFDWLARHHRAPERWRIGARAPDIHDFGRAAPLAAAGPADMGGKAGQVGLRALPQLLRSYLALGGWVSDHAVIDRDLGTCHVFTGVEIARIPPARARALRRLAG
ncbi:ornithine-acyl[acyl carrier protein] N-acyltransferase [Roseivivax lentus]|uniref:L-ornithine N(alpha)-acyltransferase n=1 Tax=Roseivivax lentus TaxID=633194 RepID=A0A1N7MNF0_9RHOB|nr:GNAT family N-acetyltransferase [Roseivivax lentus]SIS87562.1 ornithine-acyl[acyl carrier protein] N-acyltransferase [Roseivivax lentus]